MPPDRSLSPQDRANRRWRDKRLAVTLFVDTALMPSGVTIAEMRTAAYAAIYRLDSDCAEDADLEGADADADA